MLFEIIKLGECKEKRIKKSKLSLRTHGTPSSGPIICIVGVLEEEERKKRAKSLSNLRKELDIQIKEA